MEDTVCISEAIAALNALDVGHSSVSLSDSAHSILYNDQDLNLQPSQELSILTDFKASLGTAASG